MILDEEMRRKLRRALAKKAQPMKYDPRYANAEEAMRAHYYDALVQIYGPEAVYGDDDEGGEFHPYFRNRGAFDSPRDRG